MSSNEVERERERDWLRRIAMSDCRDTAQLYPSTLGFAQSARVYLRFVVHLSSNLRLIILVCVLCFVPFDFVRWDQP